MSKSKAMSIKDRISKSVYKDRFKIYTIRRIPVHLGFFLFH